MRWSDSHRIFLPWALVFMLSLVIFTPSASAAVRIFEEPGITPAVARDARDAVAAFEQILRDDLGTTLTQNVDIYLCPDRESYLRVYMKQFRQTKDTAEKSDKVFGGIWYRSSQFGVMIMDLSNPAIKSGQDFTATIGRQLFYQAIYQWAGDDFTKKAYQWLAEGTADLIGSRVAERLNFESVEKWKLDRFNVLRGTKLHVSPNDIAQRNPEMWLKYVQSGKKPAEMADLMVFYLLNKRGYAPVVKYFTQLPASPNEIIFEQAFGIDMGQFLGEFQAWYILAMGDPAQIQFTTQGQVNDEVKAYFEKGAMLARQIAYDSWNVQLRDSFRVVLAENRDVYVEAMSREFGVPLQQAVNEARNPIWTDRGSVVVMNVDALTSPEEKINQIAMVTISRMVAEIAGPSLENYQWLANGTADIIAARAAERSGFARYGDFQGGWEYNIGRSYSLPSLALISSPADWTSAANKFGPGVVRGVAALSTHYLADQYGGYAQIGECLKLTKDLNNPEAAFAKIYGMSSAQFWERVQRRF